MFPVTTVTPRLDQINYPKDKNIELILLGVCMLCIIIMKNVNTLCVCCTKSVCHLGTTMLSETKRILQTCFKSEQKTNHNPFVGLVVVVAEEKRHYRRPHRIVKPHNSCDLNWKAEHSENFRACFCLWLNKSKNTCKRICRGNLFNVSSQHHV